ncbi:MAG: LysR family transcriptional regulator [Marinobacter sp.]|nr:LysR family transcriptional regulator [Marinobacter sp.]
MANRLNLKHLHYFWVVAREGSIARAAEVLSLAPQTLSGQLASFEQAIGTRLFERRGRALKLTSVGHSVFRYAEPMFHLVDELETFLGAPEQARPTRLTVGISASIHKMFAYEMIKPALALQPPVVLQCHTGAPRDLIRSLRSQELQVVLTDRIPAIDDEFQWDLYPLGKSSISLFAAPAMAARLRDGFPESLNGMPFLANALDAPYHRRLMQWFQSRGISVREAAEVDDSALIKVFGREGLGVFAAPTVIADEVCRQYQVEAVGQLEDVEDQLYALTRPGGLFHPAIAAICGSEPANGLIRGKLPSA